MVVLIDGRVQQHQICVFKAQFVDNQGYGFFTQMLIDIDIRSFLSDLTCAEKSSYTKPLVFGSIESTVYHKYVEPCKKALG
ncbi:hypothetical protein LXL04_008061 [Taraxacum kok-saghyz]